MDVFKITDANEAMRALETVRAAEEGKASGKRNPDFAFITPALLAVGKFQDKEIGELLRVISAESPEGSDEASGRQPVLIWNVTEKDFLPRTVHLLDNQVMDVPWKTPGEFTHSPTLESVLLMCYSLKSWLDVSPVAAAEHLEATAAPLPNLGVVHCSNGKTRTGILIACLLKYSGAYATSTAAFDFFCQARAKSKPVLSPSYCIFFQNFDLVVDRNGRFPNPSHCIHLTSVSISGLPVDELPSVEIWDSCRGLVFASHACTDGDGDCDLVPTAQCSWSDQFGDGLFRASCDILSDFAVICRFGGEHARIRDKTTLIYKYQNNAAFLETAADGGSSTLTLRRDDVDVNPEYSESIDAESFVMKMTFDGAIDAADSSTSRQGPRSPGARHSPSRPDASAAAAGNSTSAAYSFLYLPPDSKASFDRGLEEISRFHTVTADPTLLRELAGRVPEDEERYAKVALQLTDNDFARSCVLVERLAVKSDQLEIITEIEAGAEPGLPPPGHEDDEDYVQAQTQVTVSEGEDGCKCGANGCGRVVMPCLV
jgi:hypothetical protein